MPSPVWIERYYSNGIYPRWDTLVRTISDTVPFCLGDILLPGFFIALLAVWFTRARSARRERSPRVYAYALLETCTLLSGIFLWFMASWAYNYDRVPVKQKMLLHPERVDTASVTALGDRTVRMLNANVAAAHVEHLDDAAMRRLLEPRFHAVTGRLGDTFAFASAPVKPTIFEPFMRASATYGFTDPWTHEINLSSALSPFERPAAYAHEWSHLAGFADESEANFIAAITCITAEDPVLRYSGWLLVWFNLPSTLRVHQHALPAVVTDVQAIVARYRKQTKPAVARAQRAVYGRYLHANNVSAGFDSYRLFVQLIAAGEFDSAGLPIVRLKK
jgi:hypothetical protein